MFNLRWHDLARAYIPKVSWWLASKPLPQQLHSPYRHPKTTNPVFVGGYFMLGVKDYVYINYI
jgi:hypothetical protein